MFFSCTSRQRLEDASLFCSKSEWTIRIPLILYGKQNGKKLSSMETDRQTFYGLFHIQIASEAAKYILY